MTTGYLNGNIQEVVRKVDREPGKKSGLEKEKLQEIMKKTKSL